MENRLVPREGFRLETLKISNYQRSFTPKAIWHNVTTLLHMVRFDAQGQGHHPRVRPGCHRRHGRLCELPCAEDGWQAPHPDGGA